MYSSPKQQKGVKNNSSSQQADGVPCSLITQGRFKYLSTSPLLQPHFRFNSPWLLHSLKRSSWSCVSGISICYLCGFLCVLLYVHMSAVYIKCTSYAVFAHLWKIKAGYCMWQRCKCSLNVSHHHSWNDQRKTRFPRALFTLTSSLNNSAQLITNGTNTQLLHAQASCWRYVKMCMQIF